MIPDKLFSNIKIIDCTLRDGGHLNKWSFSKDFARRVCSAVEECGGVHYLEVGYVSEKEKFPDAGTWRFSLEEDIKEVVPSGFQTKIAVMGDIGKVNIDNFIPKDESIIDLVRLAFYPGQFDEALELGETVVDLGYEVSLNFMAVTHYELSDFDEIIPKVYDSRIEDIYISDSFGSLLPSQVEELVKLFKKGTGKRIGLHAHNNLDLAFANIISAISSGAEFVDASIYSMSRGAGNVPLEVLLSYMNYREKESINLIPILELIEDEFIELKKNLGWGYELQYVLSGIVKCHPYYASALLNEYNMNMKDIWSNLAKLSIHKPIKYNKNLLKEVVNTSEKPIHITTDDKVDEIRSDSVRSEAPKYLDLHNGRDFLVLANGPSLKKYINEIKSFAEKNNLVILGANYLHNLIVPDYHAFSNFKRFSRYVEFVHPDSKLLIGRYISEKVIRRYTDRDFWTLQYIDDPTEDFTIENGIINSNCGTISILLIAVAITMGARRIYVAGLDGYKIIDGQGTHFYEEKSSIPKKDIEKNSLQSICERYLNEIKSYQEKNSQKSFVIITPTSYRRYYSDELELNK